MAGAYAGHDVRGSSVTERVSVDVDESEIERFLSQVPDRYLSRGFAWTAEQDAIILAGWPTKSHEALARKLGRHINTVRRRYQTLVAQQEAR